MSFKKEQAPVQFKPAWDLNDAAVRLKLREFQKELAQVVKEDPERQGGEVYFWCLKNGYYPKYLMNTDYFKINRQSYAWMNGEFRKRIECNSSNKNIKTTEEMYRALQKLIERERYAKKKEHEEVLGGQECMGKPGSARRCEICYPLTWNERCELKGWKPELATRGGVIKRMDSMPIVNAVSDKQIEEYRDPKNIENGVVGTVAEVDRDAERQEKYENRFDSEGFCKKCGFEADECECVDPSKLPF